MEWIFHIGIAQSLFAAFLLLTKRGNSLPGKILAYWMFFIALELLHMLLEIIGSPLHKYTSNFGFYSLTFGPFLYLYVRILTDENASFSKRDPLHFLPYVAFSLIHLIFFTNRPILSSELELDQGWFILNITRVIVLLFSLSGYSFYALRVIQRHKQTIQDKFSFQSEMVTLSWLRRVSFIFIITYLVLIINLLAGNIALELFATSHYIPAIGLTFFSFSLSYYGFDQPALFEAGRQKQMNSLADENLDPDKRRQYQAKLIEHLETAKPYLDPELTINALSDEVKLPRHYITAILKQDLGKNFFTLINDYRLEEIKRRLADRADRKTPVLQLAMESGFNSKSSFNSLFKQSTGMTPSEYRAQLLKQKE